MNRPAHTLTVRAPGLLRWATFLLPCVYLCAAGLPGCIVVEQDRPLVLTISVFWEDGFEGMSAEDDTCESGGVEWMDWSLYRTDDFESGNTEDPVRVSDENQHCDNFIPLDGVAPGSYVMLISGENEDGSLEWEGVCEQLVIDRFDWVAPCEVFLNDEAGNQPPMGMTDGGLGTDPLDGGMPLDAGFDATVE